MRIPLQLLPIVKTLHPRTLASEVDCYKYCCSSRRTRSNTQAWKAVAGMSPRSNRKVLARLASIFLDCKRILISLSSPITDLCPLVPFPRTFALAHWRKYASAVPLDVSTTQGAILHFHNVNFRSTDLRTTCYLCASAPDHLSSPRTTCLRARWKGCSSVV